MHPIAQVSSRAASRLRAGHVWVYASDVMEKASAEPGALVQVVDPKGKLLGTAIYSSSSQITLRLISRDLMSSETALLQLVSTRLKEAVECRNRVVRDSNAYRVVFSEADQLPGLIVDRYNDVFTFQVLTQ